VTAKRKPPRILANTRWHGHTSGHQGAPSIMIVTNAHQSPSRRANEGNLAIKRVCCQSSTSRPFTNPCALFKLEGLLEQAQQLKQISAGVSAIDKQNELMGFKIQRVESKRVDEFANMSDEELRQYVYGKELDS
jgi:hypothetical protein